MNEVEEVQENGMTFFLYQEEKYIFNPLEKDEKNGFENSEEPSSEESESEPEEEKEQKQGSLDAIGSSSESEDTESQQDSSESKPEQDKEEELLWDGSQH